LIEVTRSQGSFKSCACTAYEAIEGWKKSVSSWRRPGRVRERKRDWRVGEERMMGTAEGLVVDAVLSSEMRRG
jgi:hypothetical protein